MTEENIKVLLCWPFVVRIQYGFLLYVWSCLFRIFLHLPFHTCVEQKPKEMDVLFIGNYEIPCNMAWPGNDSLPVTCRRDRHLPEGRLWFCYEAVMLSGMVRWSCNGAHGAVSISRVTSASGIMQPHSRDIRPIDLKLGRRLSSIAADAPVKFESDTTIQTPNLAASSLCDVLIYLIGCWNRSQPVCTCSSGDQRR